MLTDMFMGKLHNLGGQSFLQGPGAARRLAHTQVVTVLLAKRGRGSSQTKNVKAENRMKAQTDLTGKLGVLFNW